MKIFEIQQANDINCGQKLDKVQDIVKCTQNLFPGSLYFISCIFEECANREHRKCLETAYLIAEEVTLLPSSDLGQGLKAIGETNIDAVNQFIKQKIKGQDLESAHYLAKIVPPLYWGQEDEMADQMPDWYNTYSYFFFCSLERTVKFFLENRDSKGDFDSELQVIQDELEDIAEMEGLDPSDAYQGRHKHDRLLKISLLLDDLEWDTKNNVDYGKIERNLCHYPYLEAVLDENDSAIEELSDHNIHPLTQLLKYDYTQQEAQAILSDDESSPEERREAEDSLKQIQKLSYYDHCLEPIIGTGQNDDPIGTLRNKLLGRPEYDTVIAEIEAINVLRRKFGESNVDIEKAAPNGKEPDIHISTDDQIIWGDITLPRPQVSYRIARQFSMRTNPRDTDYWPEKSHIQKQILEKIEAQIEPVKTETGDLTMVIIKNEDSKVDNETFKNYVLGRLDLAIPKDQSDADPVLVRGETGLEYDDIMDHLDILVLFDTLTDLSQPPYIEGQVANLNDVSEDLIDKLADAFNAEILSPP